MNAVQAQRQRRSASDRRRSAEPASRTASVQLTCLNVQYLFRKKLTKMPATRRDEPRRVTVAEAMGCGEREDEQSDDRARSPRRVRNCAPSRTACAGRAERPNAVEDSSSKRRRHETRSNRSRRITKRSSCRSTSASSVNDDEVDDHSRGPTIPNLTNCRTPRRRRCGDQLRNPIPIREEHREQAEQREREREDHVVHPGALAPAREDRKHRKEHEREARHRHQARRRHRHQDRERHVGDVRGPQTAASRRSARRSSAA